MSRFERWSRRKRGLESDNEREEHAPATNPTQTTSNPVSEKESPEIGLSPTLEEEHTTSSLQEQEKAQLEAQPDSLADTIDAQLPDPDTLAHGSDFSAFLQAGVSPSLKRRALRRMFTAENYNVRDGLDDYDHDFTQMRKLSSETTAQLRRWMHKIAEETDETTSSEEATDENTPDTPVAEKVPEATHSDDNSLLSVEEKNGDEDKEIAGSATDPARPIDRSV